MDASAIIDGSTSPISYVLFAIGVQLVHANVNTDQDQDQDQPLVQIPKSLYDQLVQTHHHYIGELSKREYRIEQWKQSLDRVKSDDKKYWESLVALNVELENQVPVAFASVSASVPRNATTLTTPAAVRQVIDKSRDELIDMEKEFNTLIYLRWLVIVKDQMDRYEEIGEEEFVLNMEKARRARDGIAREIRRQRWNYILKNCAKKSVLVSKFLVPQILAAGYSLEEFADKMSQAYYTLSVKIHSYVRAVYASLPKDIDFTSYITGIPQIDPYLRVLMANYDVNVRVTPSAATKNSTMWRKARYSLVELKKLCE